VSTCRWRAVLTSTLMTQRPDRMGDPRIREERADREAMGDLDDIVGAVGTVGDAVIEIHMDLGLGLPEYVYEAVYARALGCRGAGDFTSSDRRPSGSNPMGWSSRRDFGLT
jgi:hypothetical protein